VEMWMFWTILGVVCVIIEVVTPSFFILWFGIGAFISALMSLFMKSVTLQVLVFAAVSAVLVIFTRPLGKALVGRATKKAGVDALVGNEGVVIEEVNPDTGKGLIRVGSDVWRARPSNGSSMISVGRRVRITGVDGTHLIVEEVKREPFHSQQEKEGE